MNPHILLFAAILGLLSAPLFAQTENSLLRPEDVREVLARTRTIRSADGLTAVTGGETLSGTDALRLCQFATDVRGRLSSLLGAPLAGDAFRTEIRVLEPGEGGEDGAYVACAVAPGGGRSIRCWISDLEHIDPEDVAGALCGGYLRADALSRGWTDVPGTSVQLGAAPYPVWFGTGAARLLNVAVRQDDAERVIALQEARALPALRNLAGAESATAGSNRAVASQLVAWLLGQTDRAGRFEALRKRILDDHGWSAEAFMEVASRTPGPPGSRTLGLSASRTPDTIWSEWLARRKWVVLTPGVSHPAFVERLRSVLVLRPSGDSDTAEREGVETPPDALARIPAEAFAETGGLTPEALLQNVAEPWAPAAAAALSGRLQMAAAGHGSDVLAVATAYGAFFQAVIRRAGAEECRKRLEAADGLLQALEGGGD